MENIPMQDAESPPSTTPYNEDFYRDQMDLSYKSAAIFVDLLGDIHRPRSVIDIGCGRGTWLKAFKERGSTRVLGFDGPWNSQDKLVDPSIDFRPVDLNAALTAGDFGQERFDLAMSLEVAEHLLPERSPLVVKTLCGLSDVVMFGAAFLHQPGTDHINTRLHSFWAGLFQANGYLVFDFFRPNVWGRNDVPFWYQQNTYLYVRRGHPLAETLATRGYQPIERLERLDAIHPVLFDWLASEPGVSRTKRELRSWLKRKLPEPVVKAVLGLRRQQH